MEGRGPLIVVDIVVPEAELVRRLGSRMVCADCGANARSAEGAGALASKMVMPVGAVVAAADGGAAITTPPESGRCRRCGGQLVQRADDSDGVVRERLKVYHRQTKPLVLYYRNRPTFRSMDGAQPPDQVAAALAAAIDAAHRGATDAGGGARQ